MNIKDSIKICPVEEAFESIKSYEYGLIYYMSEKVFAKTASIENVNADELIEAYFFNEKGQLHIYQEDGLRAVKFEESPDTEYDYVDRNYELQDKRLGKNIRIREYLASDEDGQTETVYTRLVSIGGDSYGI